MTDLLWINGEIIPFSEARIGVEDRGYQFADGVYEVVRIYNGKAFTLAEHLARLQRSAQGIQLTLQLSMTDLASEVTKLLSKTGMREGMIYLQATRGVSPRNHIFSAEAKPTVLCYTRPLPPVNQPGEVAGMNLHSVQDERWKRCWIKSIALLANVLAKNAAVAAGADEAVFVEDGIVSECSASNLLAVVGGRLVTHPVGPKVLPGITRAVLFDLAAQLNIPVDERPLREDQAMQADELFITSTTRELNWVGRWGDRVISKECGPVTRELHRAYRDKVLRETA